MLSSDWSGSIAAGAGMDDSNAVGGTDNPLWIDQKYKAYEEQAYAEIMALKPTVKEVPWDPKEAQDPKLKSLRDDRGYSYADIITVHPDHLPGRSYKVVKNGSLSVLPLFTQV